MGDRRTTKTVGNTKRESTKLNHGRSAREDHGEESEGCSTNGTGTNEIKRGILQIIEYGRYNGIYGAGNEKKTKATISLTGSNQWAESDLKKNSVRMSHKVKGYKPCQRVGYDCRLSYPCMYAPNLAKVGNSEGHGTYKDICYTISNRNEHRACLN